jgi:hypothetical protein
VYQQIREAGAALTAYKSLDCTASDDTTFNAVGDLVSALENLMLAAAARDPELAEVVDEFLAQEEVEEESPMPKSIQLDERTKKFLLEVWEIMYRAPGGHGYHTDLLRRFAHTGELPSHYDEDGL